MRFLRFLLVLVSFLVLGAAGATAQWMAEGRLGRVVHLVSSSGLMIRYDLETGEHLPPVQIPLIHGALAAAAVDADGIYAVYGNSVYRYALDGTDERHVTDVQNTISSIFTDGDLLLIAHPVAYYARVTSVRKDTHAFIDFHEVYPAGGTGACISRGHNLIIGSSVGLSPPELTSIHYGDDGVFTGDDSGRPPHPRLAGSKSWVDAERGRVIDNRGNVFDLETMDYIGNLEREPGSVTSGPGGFVVGSKGVLTLYGADLKALGDVNSSSMPVMDGADLLLPQQSGPWTRLPLADFPGTPVPAVDPVKLAYTIDDAFASASGMVHLFSKAHSSLFLWDPETLAYAGVIPLRKDVKAVTYSAATDTIYTGYPGGLVRRIRLSGPDHQEEIFAQLIGGAGSIAAAGDLLFAASSGTNPYVPGHIHYVFAADGSLVSRRTNQFPVSRLAWNPGSQRMYYHSRVGSDTTLGWFGIPTGTDSPPGRSVYLDAAHYYDPVLRALLPSPSGDIIASGLTYLRDGTTLERLSGHQYGTGDYKDGAWTDGGFYSIHQEYDVSSTQNVTLVKRSDGASLALLASRKIHGLPSLVRPLSGGRLLLVTVPVGDVPSLRVLNAELGVAHTGTLTPPPVISAVHHGYYTRLKWGDVPAAASFAVQRRELPDGAWITIGTGISGYDDTSRFSGRSYEYRVIAGNGSVSSAPASFSQPSLGRPDQPVLSGTCTSTTTGILSWQADEGVQYELEYAYYTDRTAARWKWRRQPLAGSGGIDVTGLTPGSRIYFYLRATNAFGASDWSEPCAILTPPAPVDLQPPIVEADRVSLRWDEPYNTTTPRTYRLERMTGEDDTWQPVGEISPYYHDRDVENGLTYRYRIVTSNASGEAISNVVQVTIPPRPVPEVGYQMEPARHGPGTSIIVRWWFGRYERGYRIERRTEGSGWTSIAEFPPITNLYYQEYEDHTVVPDTVYFYRIVYFNEAGETPSAETRSRAAEVFTLVTEDFEPGLDGPLWLDAADGAVVADAAQPSNHVLRISGESGKVTLIPLDTSSGGWIRFRCRAVLPPVPQPPPENAPMPPYLWVYGRDSEGYETYAGEINSAWEDVSEWRTFHFELPESTSAASSPISFQSRFSGTGYWEIDDIEVSAAIPRTPPQPVDGASLTSWSGGWSPPDIRWSVAIDANGYVIERRTADGPWVAVGTYYSGGSIGGGIGGPMSGPSFYDYTALPSTTYFYRIVARNPAGDSAPAGELSYTTMSAWEQWRRLNYGQDWNSPSAAWLEDNGTGTVNLLKFAFNQVVDRWNWRPPNEPEGMPEISTDPESGLLRLRFIRYKPEGMPGVEYLVEFSDDATTWAPAGRLITREPSTGKYEWVIWQDDPPEPGTPPRGKRFCRVRVTEE